LHLLPLSIGMYEQTISDRRISKSTCDNFYQKVVKAMELSYNKPIVCPTVIGRTAELTALHQLIDQAKGGEGTWP
jgi:hypothetical protein